MKTKLILTAFISTWYGWLGAQIFTPQVMSSAGEVSTNSFISLDWTIGELSITSHETDYGLFTQGFHQPESLVSFAHSGLSQLEGVDTELEISFYPNPFNDYINVTRKKDIPATLKFEIYNAQGMPLMQRTMGEEDLSVQFNMDNYCPGLYLLKVISDSNDRLYTYRIVKSN